jgi:lysophospholipase L1-like esterase
LTKAGSYPSRLQADLAARLPAGETVTVINRGVGGDNIDDMARRVDRDVVALHPDLVIWQLGSNDALGRVPLDHFMAVARADLARIRAGGADVMLMEPQDCPVLQAVAGSSRYRDAVRELGADFAVPVINRYDMMAGWLKAASVPLLAADGLHMSDAGYARLAEAVATEIMTDAGVGRSGLTAAVK